ncbi:MAG TPA: DUF1659 domain-containing protein [Firmicutes bacterium]|nr:DUF1659 domain-containing protein [Bacillota bacterium]
MPVTKLSLPTRFQLRLHVGNDDEGNPVYRLRTFGNVDPVASDEDILEVATALGELQEYAVESIRRIDQADLVASS